MRNFIVYSALTALMVLASCSQESPDIDVADDASGVTASADSPKSAIPVGRLGNAVVPTAYRLELTILPDEDDFSGVTEIDIKIAAAADSIFLHGNGLVVDVVELTTDDGKVFSGRYEQVHASGVARIDFDGLVPAGDGVLRISYTAPLQDSAQGLYKSTVNGNSYTFTQFEPISARRVFPGFDEPVFKVPFDIEVTARDGHTVVTNTPAVETVPAGEGLQRTQFATTQPLPTYLLAFAVGPLDVVEWKPVPATGVRKWPLPLRGVAIKGKGPDMRFALDSTAALLTYLEEYFGVEYPYPKLDIIASPGHSGAMENAGAIIYASSIILIDENSSTEQQRRLGATHAHEIAHHWFGNLVTPKWWDDIWLNESFASWMSFKAAHAWRPDFELDVSTVLQALAIMSLDSRVSARQIRNPVEHNDDIGSAFDGITYLKGGGVLAMFENYLGEKDFRDGIRTHIGRFPHGVADVEDFMSSLASGSGRADVIPAFRSFIDQSGLPIVGVAADCSGASPRLTLNQSRYLPLGSKGDTVKTWEIPMCMTLGTEGGSRRECHLLKTPDAVIELAGQSCPEFIMPNADAGGYYRFALDEGGWRVLMEHFPSLSEREALAVADSLTAAYEAGRVSTGTLMEAYREITQSPYRNVIMAPSSKLKRIRDDLADAQTKPAVEAFMREIYQPRLAAIGTEPNDDESVDTALLRGALVTFLALEARDPALRNVLSEQASAYIRMNKETNELNPGAINPSFTATALNVAVQDLGAPFAETLLERLLASDDARFREQASAALAHATDPALAEWVREKAFDERLKGREPTNLIFGLAATPAERRATFDWFQNNSDEFMEIVPVFAHRFLPNIGSGFCTIQERNEVESVFAKIIEKAPAAARANREALEKIELCAALADAKRAEIAEYFGTT